MKKPGKKKAVKKEVIQPPLIQVLHDQLLNAGLIVEPGSFSDGSGSWIEIRKYNELKDMKRHSITLSFNNEGTVLEDVCCYVERFEIASKGTERIV